jgi:hypothetical protein
MRILSKKKDKFLENKEGNTVCTKQQTDTGLPAPDISSQVLI